MAVNQEQRAEALNNAIVVTFTDNELDTVDDLALICKVVGRPMRDKARYMLDYFDSIYINGERLTDTLDESQREDPKAYADALRSALRPDNNSFVSIKPKNEPISSMRAIIYDSESISPEGSAANEQKIESAITFAAEFKENTLQKQKDDALNNAVKVSADLSDIDLIKSITGIEELNDSNKRDALNSIFINGKNLAGMLGADKEDNIEEYARAVREALDINNDSFITVMKRNTIFSKPRAVIPENNYASPEERALAEKKAEISADFAANYRDNVNRTMKDANNRQWKRQLEDEKLFFASLFSENEDISQLGFEDLENSIFSHFKNIIPNYVTDRTPRNLVYVYMLTLDYPEGSGNKLTMDQILRDDSEEMKAFKAKAGKDFCRIFQKRPENDTQYVNDAEYFNAVTYPTMMEMVEMSMHMEMDYHDLKEIDDLENALLDAEKNQIFSDVNQQMQKINVITLSSDNGVGSFYTYLYDKRLKYLSSDNFLNDTLDEDRNIGRSVLPESVKYDALFESVDINDLKKVAKAGFGTITPENAYNLGWMITEQTSIQPENEDVIKYTSGEENDVSERNRNGNNKKVFKEVANQLEKDKDKDMEDRTIGLVSLCGTGYVAIKLNFLNDILENGNKNNTNSRVPYNESVVGFNGVNNSLIGELTGCHGPNNGKLAMDEKHLMAAVNAIYINGQTVAERFGLNENNIAERYEEVDIELAKILLKSMDGTGKEYICRKNGKYGFLPVDIEDMNPKSVYRRDFGSDEEYNEASAKVARERAEIKERRAAITAYADIMSGRADKETMDKFKDLKMPEAKISIDDITGLEGKQPGALVAKLGELSGKPIPQNLEETDSKAYDDFVSNIYIGSKKLTELCPRAEGMSNTAYAKKMEEVIKDTINKGLFVDDGKKARVISLRDKNGDLKPLRIEPGELPERPKPVKLYTTRLHSAKNLQANKEAYEKYLHEETEYVNKKALYDKCEKYNERLNNARKMIITEEKNGPTQRRVNVSQLQQGQRGISSSASNTPALTAPTQTRQVRNDGPTVG